MAGVEEERELSEALKSVVQRPPTQHLFVYTSNFQNTIIVEEPDAAHQIIRDTLKNIRPEGEGQDFIVFDPEAKERSVEDGGRTLRLPTTATQKCYAKLDDYGSVEALRENSGMQDVKTQYAITLMLAEDY